MNKRDEDFMIKALSFIREEIKHGTPLKKIDKALMRMIDTKGYKNLRERARLRKELMRFARVELTKKKELGTAHGVDMVERAVIKKVQKTLRSVSDRSKTWDKLESLDETIKLARVGTAHGKQVGVGSVMDIEAEPFVFYLCSTHIGAAADHKNYQGKIYVDRYWRSVLERAGVNEGKVARIGKIIEDRGILTVQEVVSGDPYIIWRNHCRHFFIPISTGEVLMNSVSTIRKNHKESITFSRPKSKKQYRKDKKRLETRLSAL